MSRMRVVWRGGGGGPPPAPAGYFRNAFGLPVVRAAAPWPRHPERIGDIVTLQVRENGQLGIWGGGVNPGEAYGAAMTREAAEEASAGGDWQLIAVVEVHHRRAREWDYIYVQLLPNLDALKAWEAAVVTAPDYGSEVWGFRRLFLPRTPLPDYVQDNTQHFDEGWLPVAQFCTAEIARWVRAL